jgi:hypothetical protein
MYPENDNQYTDKIIAEVNPCSDGIGYEIEDQDGWYLYSGDNCPIVPTAGMMMRQYGQGIGRLVRGLYIDGHEFWYRTELEDKKYREDLLYGKDACEWLQRWDSGDTVWSIEMGGLGPGYEQCIQITAAEVLRWMVANKPDLATKTTWSEYGSEMQKEVFGRVDGLGLSGAQWGAAVSLAKGIYELGPKGLLEKVSNDDRKIQVCKSFPSLA